MNIKKYFWEFNKEALKVAEDILKNPEHPKFLNYIVKLLSRLHNPKELFSLIPRKEFIENWPRIRRYWQKLTPISDFRDWWQTIYEGLVAESKNKTKKIQSKPSKIFLKIGMLIREKRLELGLTQEELALKVGMNQPDISKIEEGRKNITLETLVRLCKVLKIKRIEFDI